MQPTIGDYQVADTAEVIPTTNVGTTPLFPGATPLPSMLVVAPATVSGAPYIAGDLVRLWVRFADSHNGLIDPTTVTLKYKNLTSGGSTITQTYNPGTIAKFTTGIYYFDLDTTTLGAIANTLNTIEYEWTGAPAATGEEIGYATFTLNAAPL